MAQESPPERRRYPRVLLQVPIRMSTIDPELDPWTGRPFFRTCEETVADLSRGGARVQSREPLAPGRRLLLELDLPDGRSFEAIARVAWARLEPGLSNDAADGAYGLGLEFLGGTPDHVARLETFLFPVRPRHSDDDGLIAAAGDGYASAPMRPPGSYKIASRSRAFDALLGPELRNERRAQRILDSLRSEILEGADGVRIRRIFSSPREVFRLEIEVPELGYQRTTLLDRDALDELLATDDVRALVHERLRGS